MIGGKRGKGKRAMGGGLLVVAGNGAPASPEDAVEAALALACAPSTSTPPSRESSSLSEQEERGAVAMAPSPPSPSSTEETIGTDSGSGDVVSYSAMSDAQLEVAGFEAQSQETRAAAAGLEQLVGRSPAKPQRKRKRRAANEMGYDEAETETDTDTDTDSGEEPAVAAELLDACADQGLPRSVLVNLWAKESAMINDKCPRKRAVCFNYKPTEFKEEIPGKKFVLNDGEVVVLRYDHAPLVGVDYANGKYRARFRSTYVGRYDSQEEAGRAHDMAALACVRMRARAAEAATMGKPIHTVAAEAKKRRKRKPKIRRAFSLAPDEKARESYGTGAEDVGDTNVARDLWLQEKGRWDSLGVEAIANAYAGGPRQEHGLGMARKSKLVSCDIAVPLKESDVSLCATVLNLKVPAHVTELLAGYDRGQAFSLELRDDKGQLHLFGSHVRSAARGYLCLGGKWGLYARSRQLSATDVVHLRLEIFVSRGGKVRTAHIGGHLAVERRVAPGAIVTLEPNVESERKAEDLGFCYVPGRLTQGAVEKALKQITCFEELPRFLADQQLQHKTLRPHSSSQVKFRMRVVPCSVSKGLGVWLLEGPVPKGEILFEYGGEMISQFTASVREQKYFESNQMNFIYQLLPPNKGREKGREAASASASAQPGRAMAAASPVAMVDATHFGNVARMVNHSCDPNLEVFHQQCHIVFRAKRPIAAGEELTVDYNPGTCAKRGLDLVKRSNIKCKCQSERCRGWVF